MADSEGREYYQPSEDGNVSFRGLRLAHMAKACEGSRENGVKAGLSNRC